MEILDEVFLIELGTLVWIYNDYKMRTGNNPGSVIGGVLLVT